MNERILELAKQAGLKFPSEEALSPVEIKFAELIVKECAGIAQTYMSRFPEDHELTKQIKQHFGVEE